MNRTHATARLTAVAVAGLLLAVPTSAALAAVSLSSAAVSVNQALQDTNISNNGVGVTGNLTGTVSLSRFDSSLGVLTAATVGLTSSSRAESITADSANSPGNTDREAEGYTTGNSTVTALASQSFSISSAGTGSSTNLTNTLSTYCDSGTGCPRTVNGSTNTTTGSLNVTAGNLNSYVGATTYNVALSTPVSSTADGSSNAISNYRINWTGNLQAAYTYTPHAAPSFNNTNGDPLVVAFGSLQEGSAAQLQGFSIFNLAGSYGLDYTGYSVVSGTGFTLTTNSFSNLAGGGSSAGWSVNFDPVVAGPFSQTFRLTFADAAAGAGASTSKISSQYLDINVTGTVAPIPEPHEWAMMLAGLGMVGVIARRRRQALGA